MILEKEFIISTSHPSLEGHFPGHPLVPGVVIIDEIFSAILQYDGQAVLDNVSHLKFLAPLKPEKSCQLMVDIHDYAKVVIECRVEGRVIVKGKLVLSRREDVV